MLAPDQLIGQKVWLQVDRDPDYPGLEPYRIKAEITQPTSPPWFYARYEDPPRTLRQQGQWLTLLDAQQAVLCNPVWEEDELMVREDYEQYSDRFKFS